MSHRRPHVRRVFLALPLALAAAMLLSGQAAAIVYQHQTGLIGPWSWNDSSTTPSVTCKYGASTDGNAYPIRKLIVQPPTVYAADRDSGKVDKRTISWRFQLQQKLYPNGTWKVIASSAVQKAAATENSPASFTALSIQHRPTDPNAPWINRVQVLIKWIKPSGAVEGTLLFRPSYYHGVSPGFDFVGGGPFCQDVQTTG